MNSSAINVGIKSLNRTKGACYGFRGPVTIVEASIPALIANMGAQFDQLVTGIAGQALNDQSHTALPSTALIEQLLNWILRVYKLHKVPVFQRGYSELLKDDQKILKYILVLPETVPDLNGSVLQWLIKGASQLGNPTSEVDTAGLHEDYSRLCARLSAAAPKGMNTYLFLKAANDLGLPVRTVLRGLYCFGTGASSLTMQSSVTEHDSALGVQIAQNKLHTASLLRDCGFPVPQHEKAESERQALEISRNLGYPVVIKPADKDNGTGVAAGLTNSNQVISAYREAKKYSSEILVEKFYEGNDFRLTVLNGKLIKVIQRKPGGVTGDGISSIRELVSKRKLQQQDSYRAWERANNELFELDQEALDLLAEIDLSADSVPANGRFVRLRRSSNISRGGQSELYKGFVHPDNRRLVIQAASHLGLQIAGVDLLIDDLSRSWLDSDGVICEVNARPQISANTTPDIYKEILTELVLARPQLRFVLMISSGQTEILDQIYKYMSSNKAIGSSNADGVRCHGVLRCPPQANEFTAGSILAAQRDIRVGIIQISLREVFRYGLPIQRCDYVVMEDVRGINEYGKNALAQICKLVAPHVDIGILVSDTELDSTNENQLKPYSQLVKRITPSENQARIASLEASIASKVAEIVMETIDTTNYSRDADNCSQTDQTIPHFK